MGEIRDTAIIDALRRQMAIAAAKQVVAAGHLANVNAPGYKAPAVDFTAALERELGGTISLRATEEGHLLGAIPETVATEEKAQLEHAQLDVAATRFLKRRLTYHGFIAHDPAVRDAVLVQRPIVDHLPQSAASRCFRILASRLARTEPRRATGLRLVAPSSRPRRVPAETPQCA